MGFTDNLKNVAGGLHQGAKKASITFAQRALRLFSGLFIAIVLAIIIQEFTQNGTLMFLFFTTLFTLITYKLLRDLSAFQIFVFDVICILIAVSLRMYIMLAP